MGKNFFKGSGYFWGGLASSLGDVLERQAKEKTQEREIASKTPYYNAMIGRMSTPRDPVVQELNFLEKKANNLAKQLQYIMDEKSPIALRLKGQMLETYKKIGILEGKVMKKYPEYGDKNVGGGWEELLKGPEE